MGLDDIRTDSFGISSGFYGNDDGGIMVGGLDFLAKNVTTWSDNPKMDCVIWSVELDEPLFMNSEKCCVAGLNVFTKIEWALRRVEMGLDKTRNPVFSDDYSVRLDKRNKINKRDLIDKILDNHNRGMNENLMIVRGFIAEVLSD